jgi:integrase
MYRLFRRHSVACAEELKPTIAKKLAKKDLNPTDHAKAIDKALRTWRYCQCGIGYTGTWQGQRVLRTMLGGVTDWKQAEDILEEKMQTKVARERITLKDALARWYRETRLAQLADHTATAREVRGAELLDLAGEHTLLTAVTDDTIAELREAWVKRGVGNATQRTYLTVLATFFNFCMSSKRRWVEYSPMPLYKDWPPKPSGEDREETLPIDPDGGDENYQRVLVATRGPRTWVKVKDTGKAPPFLSGERLALQEELMYNAGLRISDAIMFQPRKLVMADPETAEYMYLPVKGKRKGRLVTTFMPVELAKKLRALDCPLVAGYPFWNGKKYDALETSIRREMIEIGKVAGVPGLHPHMFRDTFAVDLLVAGTDVKVVSEMLGHSSVQITEENYLPWVKKRKVYARNSYARARRAAAAPAAANVVPIDKSA